MSQPKVEHSPAEIVQRVILQVGAVVDLASSLGNEPDFALVAQVDGWNALSHEAKEQIFAYAREKGFKNVPVAADDGTERADGQNTEHGRQGAVENEKATSLKRRFLAYEVALDDDGFVKYSERFTERIDDGSEEVRVKAARFEFPAEVAERLMEDETFRCVTSERLTELRGELEQNRGVKFFVDRPKDDASRMIPKWKYRIGGRIREDVFSVEELPDDIMRLMRTNDKYWQENEYRQWFGRAMHAKREQVLVRQLIKELTAQAEDDRAVPPTAMKLRAAYKGDDGKVTPSALRQASREIFADFAELIHDEESADRYRGVIGDFVWTGAAAKARLAGKEDLGVTRKDVDAAVNEIIGRHLAGLSATDSGSEGRKKPSGGLQGTLRELGGQVYPRKTGGKGYEEAKIPLRRADGSQRQVRDILAAAVDSVLTDAASPEVNERVTDLVCRYVQSSSPVSERFRKQVASVERGRLHIKDAELLEAALRKFAEHAVGR